MNNNGMGWKFLSEDRRSICGNEPSWFEGETRTMYEQIVLCRRGYHDSPTIYDALPYAHGSLLARTRSGGKSQTDDEPGSAKRVSQSLTILAIRDVSKELRLWGCDCAERALNHERAAGREPDPRSWQAIAVARRFASGEASAEELVAAWAAAWAAARDAARDAARAAAWDSARDAAWDAAWDAARAAARAAVWAAARAAARDAARVAARAAEIAWQRQHLDELILPLFAGVAL